MESIFPQFFHTTYYVIEYVPARKIIANKDIPGLLRKVTKRLAIGSCYYKSTFRQYFRMTPYFITNTVLWKKKTKQKKNKTQKTMDFLRLRLGVCLRILNSSMGNLPTVLLKGREENFTADYF